MPIRLPRILRIASGGRLSTRSPDSTTSPPAMRPGGSIRPMIAEPVTDLPAPDSPTTPSTSPRAISKEILSSARKVPRRVTNSTVRSRTERTGTVIGSPQPRIERIAQPVAEQVHRQHQDRQGHAGKSDDPPVAGEQV